MHVQLHRGVGSGNCPDREKMGFGQISFQLISALSRAGHHRVASNQNIADREELMEGGRRGPSHLAVALAHVIFGVSLDPYPSLVPEKA